MFKQMTQEESSAKRKELFEKYKHMFVGFNQDGPNHSINNFGFELSAGWLKIVEGALKSFQFHLDKNSYIQNPDYIKDSEYDKDDNSTHRYIKDPEARITIFQIKEKYGTFNCYFSASSERLQQLCEESLSYWEGIADCKCERCGRQGNPDGSPLRLTRGWLCRLCNECAAKENRSFPEESDGDFE